MTRLAIAAVLAAAVAFPAVAQTTTERDAARAAKLELQGVLR